MLSGTHFVRVLRSGLQGAKDLLPRVHDRMTARRYALKLRWWGDRHQESSTVMDMDYESIKALSGSGIYELRIDDEIGGHRNLRVIFLLPEDKWKPIEVMPKPVIWLLEILPKKRMEWTTYDIRRFNAKRAIIKERFYT